jgi:hypothetical protein
MRYVERSRCARGDRGAVERGGDIALLFGQEVVGLARLGKVILDDLARLGVAAGRSPGENRAVERGLQAGTFAFVMHGVEREAADHQHDQEHEKRQRRHGAVFFLQELPEWA